MKQIQINPDLLKIYALIAMTVDHMALYLPVPGSVWERMFIGRTAFPIFAFLLMYHLYHKQIYEKYADRLMSFGFVTALILFPLEPVHQLNILFTFLFPVLSLWGFDQIQKEKMNPIIGVIFAGVIVVLMGFMSVFASYSVAGYVYLLCFYAYFAKPTPYRLVPLLTVGFLINVDMNFGYGLVSLLTTWALLHVDMTAPYKRFIRKWWVFYAYFPLHLVLILSLRYLLS